MLFYVDCTHPKAQENVHWLEMFHSSDKVFPLLGLEYDSPRLCFTELLYSRSDHLRFIGTCDTSSKRAEYQAIGYRYTLLQSPDVPSAGQLEVYSIPAPSVERGLRDVGVTEWKWTIELLPTLFELFQFEVEFGNEFGEG